MDGPEFVLVILFLFVLPIVIIGTVASHRKAMAELQLKLGNAETAQVTTELTAIKSRLEVLEAIVTDKKYQLSAEIDSLNKTVASTQSIPRQ
ncbi:hypothetical protein [Glaciecola petra]|uniref:Phage shock protein B n=1 Tax=Glaciecola petra TaxID=3075602 RepID=A0ABU2ZTL6_9ALTE|nr:hypothetical protein [Aestuariibacter sp. P117]MDT0595601.1 hypothetical protein [Aestuariibacter sp. P117]